MSTPATSDEDETEFVVSPALAAAAERDGVHLRPGSRVRLTVVHNDGPAQPQRRLSWIGAVASGKGDLGERAKVIVRAELGRQTR